MKVKTTSIKFVIKYEDGSGYVDWDDRGGPMCSGYSFPVGDVGRARMYDAENIARERARGVPGTSVVMIQITEV